MQISRKTPAEWFSRFVTSPLRGRFWGELLWAVIGLPMTLLLVIGLLVGLLAGLALSPVLIGLAFLAGTLIAARTLGSGQRRLAAKLLGVRAAEPQPKPVEAGRWLKTYLGDVHSWHGFVFLLLRLPISAAELAITAFLLVNGFVALLYPLTWVFGDGGTLPIFDIGSSSAPLSIPVALLGAALLLVTPAALHLMTDLDRVLVRVLLGTTLRRRVRDLEESRAAAVEDAAGQLRRIERDLHDGAQAQLVALAMKLGVAKDELEAEELDVDRLRQLIGGAHTGAKDALTELRDLARGIHPASLDAGLEVALSTLAARCEAEVNLLVSLPVRPPPAVEAILYFSAAELLTNAVKHSGTPRIELQLFQMDGFLRLYVSDRGRGGARVSPRGGLAGLRDRLRAVDGYLGVESPPGGPTVIVVEIPE